MTDLSQAVKTGILFCMHHEPGRRWCAWRGGILVVRGGGTTGQKSTLFQGFEDRLSETNAPRLTFGSAQSGMAEQKEHEIDPIM
jgi:hypothetical protein